MENERINPIIITDNDTGEVYELDFDRESLRFMARNGFEVNGKLISLVAEKGEEFWYYSFRKNHRRLSRQQTNTILYDVVKGLTPKLIDGLVVLYYQALESNNVLQDDEDLEKNARVTVEF